MKRDPAMMPPKKRITNMNYKDGPMGYLDTQIRKSMQQAGYPAKCYNIYRSPNEQAAAKARGVSRANAFSSSHQYYCASDIIHERYAWFAQKNPDGSSTGFPDGDQFWDCLWDCVEVVSEKFNVEFSPRLSWDPAHVQLANWKDLKSIVGLAKPTPAQLDDFFLLTLPDVWKAHLRAQKAKAEQ